MTINELSIEQLIPQRKPFVMIDSLVSSDELSTKSTFSIKGDNIFIENNYFVEAGLIENIAQTAAARAGYFSISNNQPVNLGYIGSVKNLQVLALPSVGETLSTEISIVNEIFNVSIIKGSVFSGNKLLAECEMRIFINNQTNI